MAELGESQFEPEFLYDEWEQVILGQSIQTRAEYFRARRVGRGRALARPDRAAVWAAIEQYTARLDKAGIETWAQAAERAARYEMERARLAERGTNGDGGAGGLRHPRTRLPVPAHRRRRGPGPALIALEDAAGHGRAGAQ